jgi:hypothetical protein
MGSRHAAHRTGHADRFLSKCGIVALKGSCCHRQRGDFAIINTDGFFSIGCSDDHKAATANISRLWPTDGQCESSGDRRIDSIAAIDQDLSSNSAGDGGVAYDHTGIPSVHMYMVGGIRSQQMPA